MKVKFNCPKCMCVSNADMLYSLECERSYQEALDIADQGRRMLRKLEKKYGLALLYHSFHEPEHKNHVIICSTCGYEHYFYKETKDESN